LVFTECCAAELEKKSNIQESVIKAKEAVSLDVKDGISWCSHLIFTDLLERYIG
jgi:hydroxymethylpyrimidine/phosphomethylpyrimidine kinase